MIKFKKNYKINLCKFIFSKFPIKKNKFIIWSNDFKGYSCNPKYITEYLLEKDKKLDIVWVFNDPSKIEKQILNKFRVVKYFSVRYLYELLTAKFIICNARTLEHYYFDKRAGQIYIQTWHSSLRLKTIEKDAESQLPQSYIDLAIKDSQKIDYVISGCEFSSRIFKKSFWYQGEVLEVGTPRIDYLLNATDKYKQSLRDKYDLDQDTYIILYAPTFRKDMSLKAYDIDYTSIIEAIYKKYHKNCIVLVKFHPNMQGVSSELVEDSRVINVTDYSDIQELIVCSDALITDYSSCMFDVAYMKKPCFIYATDLEEYIKQDRQLYFDIKELPFDVAKDNKHLIDNISRFNKLKYDERVSIFLDTIGSYENGCSCESIYNLIKEVIGR